MASQSNIEVGRGVGLGPDPFVAGAGAARDAMSSLRVHRPSAVLVFASLRRDLPEVLRGIRSVVGETPLLGATTAGEIADGEYHGSVTVVVLASPFLSVQIGVGRRVSQGWQAALDDALGNPHLGPYFEGSPDAWNALARTGTSAFAFLLSPGNTRAAASSSHDILEQLKRTTLGRVPIFGAGAADDGSMTGNHVFAHGEVIEDGLVVALFRTELQFGIALADGFRSDAEALTGTGVRGHEDAATTVRAGPEALRKAMLRGGITDPAVAIVAYCAARPKLLGEQAAQEIPSMMSVLGGAPLVGMHGFGEQGAFDDGVARHARGAISALVLGKEFTPAAYVAHEYRQLVRHTRSAGAEAQQQLERLVAERTSQLRVANESLESLNRSLTAEIAERRKAEQAALRHGRALRTLSACNEAVVRATDEQTLLDEVCRICVDVGGYRMSWVGVAEHDERKTVRPAAQAGDHQGYLSLADIVWADTERGRGPVGTAIRLGRPVVIRSTSADPTLAPWRTRALQRGYLSLASVPIVSDGKLMGALSLYSGDVDCFDEQESALLTKLADNLGFGIAALRGRAERARIVARLAQTDRLVATGTLAAGVAHEINNPLAYVIGSLSFVDQELRELERELGSARVGAIRDSLRDACEGADRVKHIVRDLKSLSRSDEEKQERIDLRRVIESAASIAGNEIRHRAHLVLEFGAVPALVGNAARFGQLFLNLLINAAHAIAEGRVQDNEIKVATSTDQAGRAVVEVRDSGCGIPADVLPRVFDPFFTTKPVGEGTGLGLSICHGIVRELRGEIAVESEVGRGSVFRVTLPPADDVVHRPADACQGAADAGRRGRVLVVDDEPLIARSLSRMLGCEHEVLVLDSAREAWSRIHGGDRFDAILCDVMMPEMSGMELYDRVQQVAPDQCQRMILMTGGAFTSRAREFLDGVPNPKLEKPFDPGQVRAAVRAVLG